MNSRTAPPEADPQRNRPTYPAAEAGRLVKLHPTRVRRWLKGYDYAYGDTVRHQASVLQREGTTDTSYASFLDLMDLLFVKRFLDHGVSLQKLRLALKESFEILGHTRFARQTFFTTDSSIFLRLSNRGETILELLSGGQWVIAPIIQQVATQIEFDSPEGLACRWYPLGPKKHVVLDPLVSFGRPSVFGYGVTTANVYDLFIAENHRAEAVSEWWDLPSDAIKAAVEFERGLAA